MERSPPPPAPGRQCAAGTGTGARVAGERPISAAGFNGTMTTARFEAHVRRLVDAVRREIGGEVTRLREDAGLSRRAVAAAAGVDPSFLRRIEEGEEQGSSETLIRLGLVLGADYRSRLYPNTGPTIRDRHQAHMLEALLAHLHPRWKPFTEVAVRNPARGVIDAVLHEPREEVAVAAELQSGLRRLEELVRWSQEKAASLPSWEGWQQLAGDARTSRLLIVRRTRATRDVAGLFGRQLRVAYPAHPDDGLAALTGVAPWPGPVLIWSVVDGERTRLVGGR
jgi:transcriptional regulator with XRE-family HTH domain